VKFIVLRLTFIFNSNSEICTKIRRFLTKLQKEMLAPFYGPRWISIDLCTVYGSKRHCISYVL